MRFFEVQTATAQGLGRNENQDCFAVDIRPEQILVRVADDVGGSRGGGFASNLACIARADDPLEHLLLSRAALRDSPKDGNTTLTALNMDLNGQGTFAHTGDTRITIFRAGSLVVEKITRDHTIPGMAGDLDEEQAMQHPRKNILLSSLRHESEYDEGVFRLSPGDLLLVTSDGIHDYLHSKTILNMLQSIILLEEEPRSPIVNASGHLSCLCLELIERARKNGSQDDTTVVALRILEHKG
jgi:protein phosphatase